MGREESYDSRMIAAKMVFARFFEGRGTNGGQKTVATAVI